jgi:hypothetical protein
MQTPSVASGGGPFFCFFLPDVADTVAGTSSILAITSSESDDTRGLWGLLRATRAAMAFLLALPPERLSLGDRSLISTTLRPPLRPTGPGHLCTAGRKSLDRRGCDIRTNCGGDLPPPPGES